LTLNFKIEQNPAQISILIRPYALSFLKKMSKKWEIIIFTASHQDYANAILDEMDPDKLLIHHRLYRQHCSVVNDTYIKDLSLINRDLKDMVLVDNAAYSYAYQLSNGIPILPFYDGKDYELSALEAYLNKL
jgi:CTD small phosphatase-like protein 2